MEEQLPANIKELARDQCFRNHPKNKANVYKKIKNITGRLVRELERNLPSNSGHQADIALYKHVLAQEKYSKIRLTPFTNPKRIASPMAKKYEFGNKLSFVKTDTGVIVGAFSR